MNSLRISLVLMLSVGRLWAQEAVVPPTAPPRLPSPSAWTMSYEAQPPAPKAPATSEAEVPTEWPTKLRTVVTKANGLRREVVLWDSKVETATWFAKGLFMQQIPIWPPDQLVLKRAGSDATAPDVSQTDFPELLWISRETYVGVINRGAIACHHYKGSDGEEAWLAVETKLPVAARSAEAGAWTYDYATQAAESLTLPKLFADRLAPFEKRMARYEAAQRELQKQRR